MVGYEKKLCVVYPLRKVINIFIYVYYKFFSLVELATVGETLLYV